ncbi:MAG: YeeE/YedE family protein [Desulfobacterales bacterium]|nr:YeeE/YedE family protein [Desulfobacterales bacterium]MBF0395839.1 YeeE/YedE family protein [Desulfobacterales bacterium]
MKSENQKPYSNPYLAGAMLGIVLLASFLFLGAGLGASSGIARIGAFISGFIAPNHTISSEYFGAWGDQPLRYYLVYMLIGVFLGGLSSAVIAQRLKKLVIEKGNAVSSKTRLIFTLIGGLLVGFASRLAGGCTSGQALTGGALLLSGSLIFLICVFAGGYAAAYFVRRQWDD